MSKREFIPLFVGSIIAASLLLWGVIYLIDNYALA
jgi:hypothetical protein